MNYRLQSQSNLTGSLSTMLCLAILLTTTADLSASILFATKAQRLTGINSFDSDSDSNPVSSSHIYDPDAFPKLRHKAFANSERGSIGTELSVENLFSNQSFRRGAYSMARFKIDDLVFSSTSLSQATVSLNLDLLGLLSFNPAKVDTVNGKENAVDTKLDIKVYLHTATFAGKYSVVVDRLANGDLDRTETATGILSGLSGDNIDQSLILGNVVVPTNQTIGLEIRIDSLAQGAAAKNAYSWAKADWTASFANSGNVFNVDAGVDSVDSASLLLENNHWLGGDNQPVPEPSSVIVFGLVGLCLGGGAIIRRRNKRRSKTFAV